MSADGELRVTVSGWEDGQPMQRELDDPDRWAVQACESLTVTLPNEPDMSVTLTQRKEELKRVGVGALVWEGALVLAQHLSRLPRAKLADARVVELGAGLGLVGLLAGKRGARVTLTDIAALLQSLRLNLDANQPFPAAMHVAELEWGSAHMHDAVADILNDGPLDFVLAADFLYPETAGLHGGVTLEAGHPTADAFFEAAAALCTPKRTRCLCAFEVRGSWMVETFLEGAKKRFKKVRAVNRTTLPPAFRRDHIELYELVR